MSSTTDLVTTVIRQHIHINIHASKTTAAEIVETMQKAWFPKQTTTPLPAFWATHLTVSVLYLWARENWVARLKVHLSDYLFQLRPPSQQEEMRALVRDMCRVLTVHTRRTRLHVWRPLRHFLRHVLHWLRVRRFRHGYVVLHRRGTNQTSASPFPTRASTPFGPPRLKARSVAKPTDPSAWTSTN
ncbi:hypothetical protein EBZ80_13225 [bacterium]|nr:hypothetical protein [bacterium]